MLVSNFLSVRKDAVAGKFEVDPSSKQFKNSEEEAYELRNSHLSTITHHFKDTNQFMVAIKSMQALTKKLRVSDSCQCVFPEQLLISFEEFITICFHSFFHVRS